MKNNKLIKKSDISPSKFIIYGLLSYFILYFFGPYKYTIYSLTGVVYFIFCFLLFWSGAYTVERMGKRFYCGSYFRIELSPKSEKFIYAISILSIIFFVKYLTYVISVPNIEIEFGVGDLRDLAQANRPTSNKISEILMNLGIISYLITSSVSRLKYKTTRLVSTIAFLLPGAALLAIGARGAAVISIIIYFIVCKTQTVRGFNVKRSNGKITKLIVFFSFGFFLLIILKLFSTRGVAKDITDIYLMNYGDVSVRSPYLWINTILDNQLSNVLKGLFYYTHSLPFFTWLFNESTYSTWYYGALQFRSLGFIFSLFGVPFPQYLDIVKSQPFYGYYPTCIQGFLLDWGLYLTPIMVYLTGILFGLIHISNKKGGFGYFIYPIILMMCFISPIYYFWNINQTDFVLLLYIPIYIILHFLGIKKIKLDTSCKD